MRPTPFQTDLLVALLNEQAVDADHACELAFLWDYVDWPEGFASLQMRNFDRACAALERKGMAKVDSEGCRGIYLTEQGKLIAEREREARRAMNVR